MQRFISLLTLFTLFTAYSFAQNLSIAGRVTDSESKEMLVKVAVQVYRPDSTYLTGVTTDSLGRFTAPIPQPGKYLIKFSTLGYKQLWQPLAMGTQPVSLGDIRLVQDAIMLAETVVQANIPKMVIKRSEEHTSELQSRQYLVCRLLLEKKKRNQNHKT